MKQDEQFNNNTKITSDLSSGISSAITDSLDMLKPTHTQDLNNSIGLGLGMLTAVTDSLNIYSKDYIKTISLGSGISSAIADSLNMLKPTHTQDLINGVGL